MPSYTAEDGTIVRWDEPTGPATIVTTDGDTVTVALPALAGLFDVERASLLAHLSAKDHAANLWAHELKGGLQLLSGAAELLARYVEGGQRERALAKAALLKRIAFERRDIIERGCRSVIDA